ncbi:L17 family ribosomal protein [Candidatus Vidania fulgoroideorum]
MRHNKLKKINKKQKHKKLMFENMFLSIIKKNKIKTTIEKYKIFKKIFDKKINKIKKNKVKNLNICIYNFVKNIKKNSGILKARRLKNRKGDFSKIVSIYF